MHITEILFPSRPQADTMAAVFLLRRFGGKAFPGVETAVLRFSAHVPPDATPVSLLEKGVLALDVGGGDLDHHQKAGTTLSELIVQKLDIKDDQALTKLLEYVKRDDMYGKGTISKDALDRAFGLSGLLAALNKVHGTAYDRIVDAVVPLFEAHYIEEYRRTKEMPEEVEARLKEGKAETFTVQQRERKLKVIMIESSNPSLAGYLRSQLGGTHDVVAQWSPDGHLNIMTRPVRKVDLRSLIALIRLEEMGGQSGEQTIEDLAKPGKTVEVPYWYFDTATNSLQNGGMAPQDVPPTKIDRMILRKILEVGLSEQLWKPAA